MSAHHRIVPELRLILVRITGKTDYLEIAEDRMRLWQNPTFDPAFNELVDLSGIDAGGITTPMVRDTAANTGFASGVRRSVVAPSDVAFGLSRMFEAMAGGFNHSIRVFRDLESACEWQGVPHEAVRAHLEEMRRE